MKGRLVAAGAVVVAALASTAAAAPAEDRVTLAARPTVVGGDQHVTLSGSVGNRKADEVVTIEAKDCGSRPGFFRGVASARTHAGGEWSVDYDPAITTVLRAVWNDTASAEITIRRRASVRLVRTPSSARKFGVSVVAKVQFWRKRVLIQRFDRRLGTWTTIKSVALEQTNAAPGSTFVWSSAEFKASLPKGTLVRAVFPLSQARPCYLAGVSKLVRT